MNSFTEFESTFLAALQKERSYLQGLQGKLEAQLSAWIEHLFRDYLGYGWEEILHPEGTTVGSKGSKQLFPDLQINILDNGHIFVECKRLGRLDGSKGKDELDDGVRQLRNYIRAHLDALAIKPKTVLGLVTDGNRWLLLGLTKTNEFHTIAEWVFLTDDPRLIAQRLWLLAKPALAQPTSALVEFLARRTLTEVLKESTKLLTKRVNEKLPDGIVSEESISKWLRDAFSDPGVAPRLVPGDSASPSGTETVATEPRTGERRKEGRGANTLTDLIAAGILTTPLKLFRKYKERAIEADLLPSGKIVFQGVAYDSCSQAGEVARASVTGRTMNTNGWVFWQYRDRTGKRLRLADARQRFIKTKKGQQDPLGPQDQRERYGLRKRFWEGLLSRPKAKTTRHADIKPGEYSWIGAGSGVRGLPFTYVIHQDEGRVELFIDRGANSQRSAQAVARVRPILCSSVGLRSIFLPYTRCG